MPCLPSYIAWRKKIVQRCPHFQLALFRHMGIILRRNGNAAVPQPLGHGIHGFPCLQQHGCVGMPQGMSGAASQLLLAPGIKKTEIRCTNLLAAFQAAAYIVRTMYAAAWKAASRFVHRISVFLMPGARSSWEAAPLIPCGIPTQPCCWRQGKPWMPCPSGWGTAALPLRRSIIPM